MAAADAVAWRTARTVVAAYLLAAVAVVAEIANVWQVEAVGAFVAVAGALQAWVAARRYSETATLYGEVVEELEGAEQMIVKDSQSEDVTLETISAVENGLERESRGWLRMNNLQLAASRENGGR